VNCYPIDTNTRPATTPAALSYICVCALFLFLQIWWSVRVRVLTRLCEARFTLQLLPYICSHQAVHTAFTRPPTRLGGARDRGLDIVCGASAGLRLPLHPGAAGHGQDVRGLARGCGADPSRKARGRAGTLARSSQQPDGQDPRGDIYIYKCVCVYVYTCIYIYIRIYIYIYIDR